MTKPYSFMKIEGIEGESYDHQHENWIDVLSWGWGCEQSVNIGAGSHGRSRQRGQVQPFRFTKWLDKSSPALAYSTLIGEHIDRAEFHLTKAGDDGVALIYTKFIFEGVLIANYTTSGGSAGDRAIEEVTIAYNLVSFEYIEQTAQGGGGAKPKMEWRVPEARGSIA